jgi:hypothetical protein
VIINTIYCGDKWDGVREHWNVTGECGNGSFTNINQDSKIDDITTPYDSVLFLLNDQLNETYIAYGAFGKTNLEAQEKVDRLNYSTNKSAAAKRVEVKSKKALYRNTHWDLVDAYEDDSLLLSKINMKTLPDSLQKKSYIELKEIVRSKKLQREKVQKEIIQSGIKREEYIKTERAKQTSKKSDATLETEIEKIIKQQAKKFNMVVQ